MKYLLLLSTFITTISFSQQGKLVCNFQFGSDQTCKTTNLILSSKANDLYYYKLRDNDTISEIPSGMYTAFIYNCDSSFTYSQKVEILEDDILQFYVYVNSSLYPAFPGSSGNLETDYYYDYPNIFINNSFRFGIGLDYDNSTENIANDFTLQYAVGQDFLFNKSIVAMGYNVGISYYQTNYTNPFIVDSTFGFDKERYSSINLSPSLLASIYIKNRKILDVGVKYNLPLIARVSTIGDNYKLFTKGIHNYNDMRAFAHIGFHWGFLFGEYRFNNILDTPYQNSPKLTVGICLNPVVEW